MTRVRLAEDRGMTLVELLVTMMVLTILGTFAVSSVIQGSRSTSRAQDRVEGMADVQLGMERISRDLRAADPLTLAQASAVGMRVTRDGQTIDLSYTLSGEDLLEERTVGAVTTTRTLAEEVDAFAVTYFDEDNAVLAAPVAAGDLDAVVRVHVRIERFIPRANEPIELETTVHLRNAA